MPHIYQDILNSVQKPVRYLGNEWNVIRKSKQDAPKRVVLCFPDTYELGMSHLGIRILYSILNKRGDTAAERCFAPWIDMLQKLRESGLPLVSMESQTPLHEFDVVGFSLQYELEYTNILAMLDLGGIPLYSRDRDANAPLVIAGGPCAFSPEPVADFFDCILLGDGEAAFPQVVDRFIELRDKGLSRRDILISLTECPGIYVPSLYETAIDPETDFQIVTGSEVAPFPVKRTYVEDINEYPFPDDILVPHTDIVHNRVSIEVARGCTEGCRFCQAGTIYRPVRERKPEDIINTVMSSLEKTGFGQASLTALSTADFSCIGPLAQKLSDELEKKRAAMAVSSMRVYGMTDELGESLSKVRRSGFTIAPEAGTQRMRDVINKGITEEVILEGSATAFRNGWSHIKLYFMIGLPTETQADLQGIIDLGVKILHLAEKQHGKKAQVTISVSSHIPKPHAPFQWLGLDDSETLRQKQVYLRNQIARYRRLRFKWHDVEHSWLEAIFSRGDRRLSRALELAYRRGCVFDAWTDQLKLDVWREVLSELDIDPEIWMKEIPLTDRLPWDHIDSLVKTEWLVQELKRSMKERFSPACEKPFKKKSDRDRTDLGKPSEDDKLVCYHCGLECDLDAIRQERIDSWNTLANGVQLKVQPKARFSHLEQEVTRYRTAYGKLGEFSYLSALDLTRVFARAFNRSQVPLRFSEGFHPAPVIAFGPALGVGLESVEEYLDFETAVRIPADSLLTELNQELPDGLKLRALRVIDRKAESLFKVIETAEYSVQINWHKLRSSAAVHDLNSNEMDSAVLHRDLVEKLFSRDNVTVEKTTKGRVRTVDVKPLILGIEVCNSDVPLQLRMRLATGNSGSVRPEVVLKALYGAELPPEVFAIRRERLFATKNREFVSPMELGQAK